MAEIPKGSEKAQKRRKPPQERREEIVQKASAMALAGGLESLTLRGVAAELSVASSLIGHYFPIVDDLIAEAFVYTAATEIEAIFAAISIEKSPLQKMKAMLSIVMGEDRDPISLFWLDAWQSSRKRPKLRGEIATQMRSWETRLAELIKEGATARVFRVKDPMAASLCILRLVDSLSFHAAMRPAVSYNAVAGLMVRSVERELGLRQGRLGVVIKSG